MVTKTVTAFLDCGVLRAGFARVRCPECHAEHLLTFSCKGRGLCPSCQAKRAELFAEKLREEILAPVAHRHVVFTIPKALRKLFLRERTLLDLLPRAAFEALRRCLRAALDRKDGVPGFVVAIQSFGKEANFHPHLHGLVSDGLFLRGGEFVGGPLWDEEFERLLTETFPRLVLAALRKRERLSESFNDQLLTWGHGGGFSVYGRHLILNAEPARLAHMARYAARGPVAVDRVSMTSDGKVLLSLPAGHDAGGALVLDPMEFIRRLTWHIPDARTHQVRYHGAYANRSRALYRAADEGASPKPVAGPAGEPKSKSRASWARLIRRVFECDPLTCPRCGKLMRIVAFLTEPRVIDEILRHLEAHPSENLFHARDPPAA